MDPKEDVRIMLIEPVHSSGILELAENVFNKYEPIAEAMAEPWEQVRQAWEDVVVECGQPPICSHVAVNNSNKVVGFQLSRILEMKNFKPVDSLHDNLDPGVLRTILDRVTKDWAKTLVDDEGHTCQKMLQYMDLCVHPDYGGRGLGEELTRVNLANGSKLGCDYCVAVGSNWMSQKMLEKLGFRLMGELEYDEYKDDFQIKDAKQKYSKGYFLKLEKVSYDIQTNVQSKSCKRCKL